MPHGIPDPSAIRRIHLMAICGTGMGAFAGLLKEAGYEVRGSDAGVYPPMSTQLQEQGIELMDGFRPENLDWDPDLVVVGNAIRRTNPEAEAMRDRDLTYASFPETLSELFLASRHPIVVAGTHGKTTTSSVLAHCLHALGATPQSGFLVGGVLQNFGRNFRPGEPGGFFVVEGDEYDTAYFDKVPKFIHYRPRTAVLTSVEFDHADIYRDLDHVREAFGMLIDLVPDDGVLFACADGAHVPPLAQACGGALQYYSTRGNPAAQWQGAIVGADRESMTFTVSRDGSPLGTFRSSLIGEHNLANLVAVVAVLTWHGFETAAIAGALDAYLGVRRRQEVFAEPDGVTLIDDFAHHPTAVRATIDATRLRFGQDRTLWTVFEPRTNTTRRNVFQEAYGHAFSGSDHLVVAPVHRADGIPEEERFDPDRLVADARSHGVDAVQADGIDHIVDLLAERTRSGDIVLILSNGGFGGIYESLPRAIEARGA
jgi:UDP-N-acetylmuramate: L-alanyl-gamma-D-glutamyl-meso-diaminopimelate ligase